MHCPCPRDRCTLIRHGSGVFCLHQSNRFDSRDLPALGMPAGGFEFGMGPRPQIHGHTSTGSDTATALRFRDTAQPASCRMFSATTAGTAAASGIVFTQSLTAPILPTPTDRPQQCPGFVAPAADHPAASAALRDRLAIVRPALPAAHPAGANHGTPRSRRREGMHCSRHTPRALREARATADRTPRSVAVIESTGCSF